MTVVPSLNLGTAILAESALSFLGIGLPPTLSWGNTLGGVLAEAFRPPWWIVLFPGLALTLTILCCNLVGDALRDCLNPKLRHRLLERLPSVRSWRRLMSRVRRPPGFRLGRARQELPGRAEGQVEQPAVVGDARLLPAVAAAAAAPAPIEPPARLTP